MTSTRAPRARRHLSAVDDHAHESESVPEAAESPEGIQRPLAGLVHDGAVQDVQRDTAPGPADDPLGGARVAPEVAEVLRRRQGTGSPLPADIAGSAGEALGTDLSAVRVHADAEADAISRSMQAAAFTHGSDVYVTGGPGVVGSAAGSHLLAHELVHVAQNSRGGGGSAAGTPVIGPAHDPAEAEADQLAGHVVQRLRRRHSGATEGQTGPLLSGGPTVQRVGLDALRRQTVRAGGSDVIRRGLLADVWNGIKSFFGKKDKKKAKAGKKSTAIDEVPQELKGPEPEQVPTSVVATQTEVEPEVTPEVEQVQYPTVITIGSEKVKLEQESDLEEARTIINELKNTYGIDLSSPTAVEGVKGNLSVPLAQEIDKLKGTTWEMKELRSLRVAVSKFAPILGDERKKSTLAEKAQGVTTIGRVTDAFDPSPSGPQLVPGVMGEYFGKNNSVALFNTTTDLVDNRYIAEGQTAADNLTTITANAIHEMAHGLVQPVELGNWVTALEYWTDANSPSGKPGAEAPPTTYGTTNAGEDLAESVAIYFINRPMLARVAPEREKFIAAMVAGWKPAEKKEVLETVTTAKGTGE